MKCLRSVSIAASCAVTIVTSSCATAETHEESIARQIVVNTVWATKCGVTLGPVITNLLKNAKDQLHLMDNAPTATAVTVRAVEEFNRFSEQEKLVRCFFLSVAYSK